NLELTAMMQSPYNARQYGVEIVMSPQEADVLALTGVVSKGMSKPVQDADEVIPRPRRLVLIGDCALGKTRFCEGKDVDEAARKRLVRAAAREGTAPIEVPGCPPAPAKILAALLWPDEATEKPRGG